MKIHNILIIDDDSQIRSSYERILAEDDYTITSVNNGKEAIELFKKNKYSLILTDIEMEGITGLQVLKEAKRYCPDTPVILISGYATIETTIEGLRKGAFDYIFKPCEKEEIKLRIKKAIERQKIIIKAKEAEYFQIMSETLGAVAHEINNPLTGIIGNADLLLADLPKSDPNRESLSDILNSAERISDIIEKMRDVRGIERMKYTKDSEIIDIQKSSDFTMPESNTILIVDDDDSITTILKKFLLKAKFNLDTADRGLKALEKIKEKNYSVVLLDVSMPEMDGHETLKRIIKYYTDKKVRIPAIIMMTGYEVEDILQKCKDEGAYTVMHKPFNLKDLHSVIIQAEELAKK